MVDDTPPDLTEYKAHSAAEKRIIDDAVYADMHNHNPNNDPNNKPFSRDALRAQYATADGYEKAVASEPDLHKYDSLSNEEKAGIERLVQEHMKGYTPAQGIPEEAKGLHADKIRESYANMDKHKRDEEIKALPATANPPGKLTAAPATRDFARLPPDEQKILVESMGQTFDRKNAQEPPEKKKGPKEREEFIDNGKLWVANNVKQRQVLLDQYIPPAPQQQPTVVAVPHGPAAAHAPQAPEQFSGPGTGSGAPQNQTQTGTQPVATVMTGIVANDKVNMPTSPAPTAAASTGASASASHSPAAAGQSTEPSSPASAAASHGSSTASASPYSGAEQPTVEHPSNSPASATQPASANTHSGAGHVNSGASLSGTGQPGHHNGQQHSHEHGRHNMLEQAQRIAHQQQEQRHNGHQQAQQHGHAQFANLLGKHSNELSAIRNIMNQHGVRHGDGHHAKTNPDHHGAQLQDHQHGRGADNSNHAKTNPNLQHHAAPAAVHHAPVVHSAPSHSIPHAPANHGGGGHRR